MSRMSETPNNVLETYDWQDAVEDLQEKLDKALKDNKQLKDLLNKANDEVVSYCNCCIDLQQKIDKAKEYIKTKWKKDSHYDSIENCLKFCKINAFEKDDLLQMLGDKK